MPGASAIYEYLSEFHNSKARWIGVQMYHYSEGLAVSLVATQSESYPGKGNAIYSRWTRVR